MQFVRACESVEDSADMKFIVENKIRKHYLKADKGFISSTAFRKRLRDLKVKVENDKQNLYVHITELVDELKARKVQYSSVYCDFCRVVKLKLTQSVHASFPNPHWF